MSIIDDVNESTKWDEPSDSDKEIISFVVEHTNRWRDYRNTNYLKFWNEYDRIFRGKWATEDKTRESERSRIISPATQQAIETRHAEIMEAIFGDGEFFDIADNWGDNHPMDVQKLKGQLKEDLEKQKIRKAVDQIELLAEIYGTGIGEITVKKEKELVPVTKPIPGSQQAAYGVEEREYTCVKLNPINPKNFLIDPNATSIEEAMGCAVEKYVSIHKIVEGMEKGIYRKVNIAFASEDVRLEPDSIPTTLPYRDEKVKVLTYYGLVPAEYIDQLENDGNEVVDLFPEDSVADEYSGLVEAIVVIANDGMLLKAERTPYMMKDRPVVAYQDDTVPNRFWGRGTAEKAYNMQKAIDAQLRAHLDSLALTTAPMVAMDATRLPRGAKFEVKPGKAILTNGSPSDILMPFTFGQTSQNNLATSQNFERLLLQATGTVDSAGLPSSTTRDATGGMSMALAGVIKKYKRTLTNFQEDFMIPFIKKAVYRYMQFDPERYPAIDMQFIPTATLGIMAREYEQSQFIALLQTLGPNTPVLPLILKGIIGNSSLSNKQELTATLDKMSQPDPQAQQLQQAQQQLQLQQVQAQNAVFQSQAVKNQADAQKTQVEAALAPEEVKAKLVSAMSTNIHGQNSESEFAQRAKIAELMLKEQDINNKAKIVELQMQKAQK